MKDNYYFNKLLILKTGNIYKELKYFLHNKILFIQHSFLYKKVLDSGGIMFCIES